MILERPFEVLDWSAAELADAAKTSTATVIRACHRLGFPGLPQLRIRLARDLGWSDPSRNGQPTEPGRIATELFESAAQTFASLAGRVDGPALERAVDVLAAARRVLIVCSGPTQALCVDVQASLNLFGRHTEFPADAIAQQIAASNLSGDDACIAISTSGTNGLTVRAAEIAGDSGATVVGVTCFAHSRLASLAGVPIVLGMHRVAAMADTAPVTTAALLLLLRALTTAVARRISSEREYQAHLQTLGRTTLLPRPGPSPRG